MTPGDLHTVQVESPNVRHRVTGLSNTRAAHAARPAATSARVAVIVAALAVVGLIAGLGVAALLRKAGSLNSNPTSAKLITVYPTAERTFPMARDELAALVHLSPDLGPLADPARLSACLAGLGYPPSIEIRGAHQVDIDGAAVVLLLPGSRPENLVALAVRPDCDATTPHLVTDTTVISP